MRKGFRRRDENKENFLRDFERNRRQQDLRRPKKYSKVKYKPKQRNQMLDDCKLDDKIFEN